MLFRSVGADYTFAGWYTTVNGLEGSKFDFEGKTLNADTALYAKWVAPTHTLRYYDQPGGNLLEISEIPHGSTISEGNLTGRITPTGLTEDKFQGWYWHVGSAFVKFDFDFPIENNDIIVYPVWDSSNYKVSYLPGTATGDVPVDENLYHLGAAANVLSPDNLIPPKDSDGDDMIFLGWTRDGSSKIYYPNDKLTINGHMTLTAKWGIDESKRTIQLTYDGNGGATTDGDTTVVVKGIRNNETVNVADNQFVNTGYTFDHWNTASDGSGSAFKAGESTVIVDNIDPANTNVLYAGWLKINLTKTGVYEDTNGDGSYSPGDKIHYIYEVTSNSIVPLSNITLSDDKLTPAYESGEDRKSVV